MISRQRKTPDIVDVLKDAGYGVVEGAEQVRKKIQELSEEKEIFGDQLLDEVIKDPTINIYLDRSPKLNTQPDYEEMVRRLQRQRAIFINAEQKKKEPKIEGED